MLKTPAGELKSAESTSGALVTGAELVMTAAVIVYPTALL